MESTVSASTPNIARTNALKTFGVNFIIAIASFASYKILDEKGRPILVFASAGAIVGYVISRNQKNPIIGTLIGTAIGAAAGFMLRNNATIKPIFQDK